MNSEQAKTYTQQEVDEMIAKAIRQDREFLAQVLRALPLGDAETKQGWIEKPKDLADTLSSLCRPKRKKEARLAPKHLYEFTIRKTGASAEDVQTRMDGTYFVSDYAKTMMGKPEYTIGPIEDVLIRVYRVDALGVKGWSETDFFGSKGRKHLEQLGLAKCLPDDAPCIREAHDQQKLDEWIVVAHNQISASGYSSVFGVGRSSVYGRCLSGRNLSSHYRLGADYLVAVRVVS